MQPCSLSITCARNPSTIETLPNGAVVNGLALLTNEQKYYVIEGITTGESVSVNVSASNVCLLHR